MSGVPSISRAIASRSVGVGVGRCSGLASACVIVGGAKDCEDNEELRGAGKVPGLD